MKKTKKVKLPPRKNVFDIEGPVRIDLGCGDFKQSGFIGVDFRGVPGVDVEQDLSIFPWKGIPTEIADLVLSSHVLEHINPSPYDPRLAGLIDLMLAKKVVSKKDIEEYVGQYRFLGGFISFMDEVWRILKPGGKFVASFPYGGSPGYWQDPTHINGITELTLPYFDPIAKDPTGRLYNLYRIYRPKPWKICACNFDLHGIMEVSLEKREIDRSYKTADDGNMSAAAPVIIN